MNSEINISFSWTLQDFHHDMWFMAKWMAVHEWLQHWKKGKRLLVYLSLILLGLSLYGLFGIPLQTPQDFLLVLYGIIALLLLLSLLIPSWERWVAERMAAVKIFLFKTFKKKLLKELESVWIAKFGDGQAIQLKLKLNEEKIELFCGRTPEDEGVFWGCANSEERLQYCRMDHCVFLVSAGAVDSGHLSEREDSLVMIVNLQRLQPQEQEQFLAFLTSSPWCEHTEDILKDVLKRKSHKKSHQ